MILLLPLLLAFHILILSQITFTAWPEMLSYPYLLAHGFTLYKDYVMPYPPGLVWLLSGIFQSFGFNVEILKYLTWTLILTEDLFLYLISRKLTNENRRVGFIFLGIFIFLQSFLDGNMLWFDLATSLPLLIAFYFGMKWLENFNQKNLFLIGLFLGLAVLIKQTAIIYLLAFGLIYLKYRGIAKIRELAVFVAGVFVLWVSLYAYLLSAGLLSSFTNWVLIYPLTQWSKFPGYVNFALSKKQLLVLGLILLPALGGLLQLKKIKRDKVFLFSGIFTVAALISVYPRFSFFHLQPAIPFITILILKTFNGFPKGWQRRYAVLLGVVVISVIVLLGKGNFINQIRFYATSDQNLAREINASTKDNRRVFLLGLNSSEYVFAGKLPPVNWSDNFGWYLEIPEVQDWVIQGLKITPPEKVFWRVPNSGNWYDLGTYQPQKIIDFIRQNYILTGKIEGGVEIWTKRNSK